MSRVTDGAIVDRVLLHSIVLWIRLSQILCLSNCSFRHFCWVRTAFFSKLQVLLSQHPLHRLLYACQFRSCGGTHNASPHDTHDQGSGAICWPTAAKPTRRNRNVGSRFSGREKKLKKWECLIICISVLQDFCSCCESCLQMKYCNCWCQKNKKTVIQSYYETFKVTFTESLAGSDVINREGCKLRSSRETYRLLFDASIDPVNVGMQPWNRDAKMKQFEHSNVLKNRKACPINEGEITGNVEMYAWKKKVALQNTEQILIYACLNVPMVCILLVWLSWHSSNGNHELAHQKVSTVIIGRLSLFTYVALPCFTVAQLDQCLFQYNLKWVDTIL